MPLVPGTVWERVCLFPCVPQDSFQERVVLLANVVHFSWETIIYFLGSLVSRRGDLGLQGLWGLFQELIFAAFKCPDLRSYTYILVRSSLEPGYFEERVWD